MNKLLIYIVSRANELFELLVSSTLLIVIGWKDKPKFFTKKKKKKIEGIVF